MQPRSDGGAGVLETYRPHLDCTQQMKWKTSAAKFIYCRTGKLFVHDLDCTEKFPREPYRRGQQQFLRKSFCHLIAQAPYRLYL
jgi:hypothetical protein